MRNIFDQFEGRENRLTHALVSALDRDPKLLRGFFKRFAPEFSYDARTLRIEEQTLPGESPSRLPEESRGLPDAVMWDSDGHLLAIESKVTARLARDQLRRHERTVRRRGFTKMHGLAIVVRPKPLRGTGWYLISWIDIYRWLGQFRSRSRWADELARYIEIMEMQMTDDKIYGGARLTDFSGIHFSEKMPYSYHAAKMALRGLIDSISSDPKALRQLGLLPGHVTKREAITGQGQDVVWSFIAYEQRGSSHTSHVHFTADIYPHEAAAFLTMPNGAGKVWRKLRDMEFAEFRVAIGRFIGQLGGLNRTAGVTPQVHLLQRRFKSQRSPGIKDGQLIIDPRTGFQDRAKALQPTMKHQPQWLELLYALIQKKSANFQLQIGCRFEFEKCRALSHPQSTQLFIQTWLAGKAFLDSCGIPVRPFKTK